MKPDPAATRPAYPANLWAYKYKTQSYPLQAFASQARGPSLTLPSLREKLDDAI